MTKPDTRKLLWAVTDDVWEHFDIDDSPNVEWFIEHIEEPFKAMLCYYEGHVVDDDQCMIPGHRYCVICGEGKPNGEIGRHRPEAEGDRPGASPVVAES